LSIPSPTVRLNNGVDIPRLGFGVLQIAPDSAVSAVSDALAIGYRHIDTAQGYGNEREVGEAVARSDIPRDEVFVTSKVDNTHLTYDDALQSVDRSLADLGFDYLDLVLIHWPMPKVRDYVAVWRALEQVYGEGRARAIGVSNFKVDHLERLLAQSEVVPAVNQIEVHPFFTQVEMRHYGESRGIRTEAWGPLARGRIASAPTVRDIADRVGRTPAQVVLRWHLQIGTIVFPKSAQPERMRENFELFDFELAESDVAQLSALNRDDRTGPDPDEMNTARR
jgi:2,5-diketo-D-gluconate reductase A